jgi:hypothetical protein
VLAVRIVKTLSELYYRILSWFEGNVEGIYLFKRFEPEIYGK